VHVHNAACVLGEVEAIIKRKLSELNRDNPELFWKRYQVEDSTGQLVEEDTQLSESNIHVYLADFVDIVSGKKGCCQICPLVAGRAWVAGRFWVAGRVLVAGSPWAAGSSQVVCILCHLPVQSFCTC
jgi:hypothetical protein